MEITFHLPADFTLPLFYEREDPQQVALALRLGADAVEQLYKKTAAIIREETHEQTTKELEADFHAREEKREKEITKLEELIRRLREQNASLEAMMASMRDSMLEKVETLAEERVKAKEAVIDLLRSEFMKTQDALLNKVDRLTESAYKNTSNSSLKGKSGEVVVEELLKTYLDCEVYPMSSEAYSGDHHIVRGKGKYKYIVDAKNYGRMVSQAEVNKLHRDLRVNADAVGAVMIALNHGIVGHTIAGDIDLEFNEHGKPIVYIGNLQRRDEVHVLFATVRLLFEVIERNLEMRQQGGSQQNEVHEKLQSRSELVATLLRTHMKTAANAMNTFTLNKKKLEAIYNDQYASLVEMEGQIKTLLAVAIGNEEQTRLAMQDDEMPLPSSIFKRTNRTELTEKEVKFVVWMQKTFLFEDGKDLETSVFTEKAKAEGFGEKDMKAFREKLLNEEVWPKQGKKLRGLCLA